MKIVLAYSGGLDTSVLLKYLQEKHNAELVALTADVGEGKDLDVIRERALKVGAVAAYTLDLREEFADEYVLPCIKANGMYEGVYPLVSALSRPLIVKKLVEVAAKEGADAVAHGCTGKGNDQVRFDVGTAALAPHLKTLAPMRDWGMTRSDEIDYAHAHGIDVPLKKGAAYSIDENLWGISIESGPLEDPWTEPPKDAYRWTTAPEDAPDKPEYLEIEWEKGKPVSVNGKSQKLADLIESLNDIAGQHGVGRIDHIENRLVGIKSREVYECPGATVILKGHKALEDLILPRELSSFKAGIDAKWAEVVYTGLWYSPLKEALDAFIESTQERITGTTRVKLYKGNATVVGLKSPYSMYDMSLATYEQGDLFSHSSAAGFIDLYGLPTRVWSRGNKVGK
jgi:argininosuccinate synthase